MTALIREGRRDTAGEENGADAGSGSATATTRGGRHPQQVDMTARGEQS
nr:hypothetical protein [Streptomyces lushanensis]